MKIMAACCEFGAVGRRALAEEAPMRCGAGERGGDGAAHLIFSKTRLELSCTCRRELSCVHRLITSDSFQPDHYIFETTASGFADGGQPVSRPSVWIKTQPRERYNGIKVPTAGGWRRRRRWW